MARVWKIGCVLWLVPALAWAADDLTSATNHFRRMDYPRALVAAERVLQSADSGPLELLEAYRLQGLCHAALGHDDQAVLAFRRLLSIDPAFRLPKETSPKLTPPFFQAVGMTVDKGGIRLQHEPPAGPQDLAGLELEAALLADPLGLIKSIRFRYWDEGEQPLQMLLDVKGPGKVAVMVPRAFSGRVLHYSFEAILETGGALARAGGPEHVFELRSRPEPAVPAVALAGAQASAGGGGVPTKSGGGAGIQPLPAVEPPTALESTPPDEEAEGAAWYKSWWFWTVVGAALAGAAAGTAVALTAGGGSSDTMHFQIEFR